MPSSGFIHFWVETWTLGLMLSRFIVLFVLLGSGVSAQYDQCTGITSRIGDGHCDAANNNAECEYDGGDCCYCSCPGGLENTCGSFDFDCQDPEYVGGEVFDCIGENSADGPCSTDTATEMMVNDTASATALADAIRCSGGVFNVRWLGHVVVSRTIKVADGTVLNVTGGRSGDEMQATRGTRLIAVINASLEIRNMKITGGNATFGGAIAAVGSYIALENTSFSGNDALAEGGALYATSSTIISRAERTVFDGNHSGRRGGALTLTGATSATFHGNSSFTNNNAGDDGGALYISSSIVSWAGNAVFSNNSATLEGGALYTSSSNVSWAGDAFFFDNTAYSRGGALYTSSSIVSWAGNAVFSNNSATLEGGALYTSSSNVSWTGRANFSNNIAHDDGGALAGSSSTVSWVGDAFFFDNTAYSSGGAVIVWDSSVSWVGDAVFSNNTANDTGGALYTSSSVLSWSGDAVFSNNSATLEGGALYTSSSNVSWSGDAVFSNNIAHDDGGALAGSSSTVSWVGDAFFFNNTAYSSGGVAIVWDSNVSWAGDAVFANNTANDWGGVAYVSTSSVLSWSGHAVFSDNSAKIDGGALYVSSSSVVTFGGKASFLANTAGRDGGAIYIRSGARVLLKTDTLLRGNSASGDGGALYIYGNDEEQATSVNFTGTAKFLNNLCQGDGGALVIVAGGWVTLPSGNATFSHNSALTAGGAIAVIGSAFGPQFTGLSFLSNDAQIGGAAYVTSSGTALTENQFGDLTQNPTAFDRCKFIGNRAGGTGGAIDTSTGLKTITNTYFEGNTARVGGALRLGGITSLDNCTFKENTSDDGEGAAISNMGSVSSMNACSFLVNSFLCKTGEFLDYQEMHRPSRVFDLLCKGCDAECDDCDTSSWAPVCTDVLENTESTGGNTTIEALEIKRGYWRATIFSKNVLACYNTDACHGGLTGSVDFCTEGYEGPYCSICREGYSPGLGHTCSRCSESIASAVFTVIVVILLLSFLIWGKSTGRGRGLMALWRGRLLSLKMVVIVWQVTTQFASVANIMYPKIYQKFLDRLDVINFNISWILSAGCIIELDFHHRLIMSTLGPFVALAIIGGMYVVRRWRNRASYDGFQVASNEEIRRKHLSLVLLLTFLVYSSVSSTLFQMFACDELDDGKSYLRADYRIDCTSPTHTTLQAYAVCMMFVYTGGIPVLYGILLFRNRQVLMDESARQECAETRSISNLWELYKPHRFYYELIECARRILLAGVVVFIFPNTAAQVGIALMIAAFFMVFSEMVAPYESVWDAWVNRFGHALVFGSIYLALLLKIDVSGEREDSQSLFETTLIAGHIVMFLLAMSGVVVVTYQWINGGV